MNQTEAETRNTENNPMEPSLAEKSTFEKEGAYIDSAQLETQESPEKGGQEEESKILEKEQKESSQGDKKTDQPTKVKF